MVEKADGEEAKDERSGRAPQPEILVQRVQNNQKKRSGNSHVSGLRCALHYPKPLPSTISECPRRTGIVILTGMQASPSGLESPVQAAREALDAWVREVVAWHFDPATGCSFWLDYAR